MARGKEEAEWWRLSHLEAFIANRIRFSDGPTVHPKDINPLYRGRQPKFVPKDGKDMMSDFFARHSDIPLMRMKQREDGTWETVAENGNGRK